MENHVVKGKVLHQLSPIPFVTIQLVSKDTTLAIMTDSAGVFRHSLKAGVYKLIASAVGYKSLECPLDLNNDNGLRLQLNMVKYPSLTWYVIESAKPLKQSEIERIKKCVSIHEGKPFNCNKSNLYQVSIEI